MRRSSFSAEGASLAIHELSRPPPATVLTSLEFLPGYPLARRDLNTYQELHLESYQTFASADLLTAHTVAAM